MRKFPRVAYERAAQVAINYYAHPEYSQRNMGDRLGMTQAEVQITVEFLRESNPQFREFWPKGSHPESRSKSALGYVRPHPVWRTFVTEDGIRKEGYYDTNHEPELELVVISPAALAAIKAKFRANTAAAREAEKRKYYR